MKYVKVLLPCALREKIPSENKFPSQKPVSVRVSVQETRFSHTQKSFCHRKNVLPETKHFVRLKSFCQRSKFIGT